MQIRTTSEITVRLIQSMGGDLAIYRAARVSTAGVQASFDPGRESPESQEKLIAYLMKNKHGSPFEHSSLTFFAHVPAFVWWEWVRHRVLSFNLESSRYKKLEPLFWIPRPDRKFMNASDHKSAHPSFANGTTEQHATLCRSLRHVHETAYREYDAMISAGIANEVARTCLPFAVYFSGWVTFNPRSLMHFLSLRTFEPDAKYPSRPQAEIEEVGRATEKVFAEGWPLTYKAWNTHGRVAP